MKSKIFVAALSIFSFSAATISAQVPENVTVNSNTLPQANTPSTTTEKTPKGKVKKNYPRPTDQANKSTIPAQRPSKKPEVGGQPNANAEGKQHKEHHDGDLERNKGAEKPKHKEGEKSEHKSGELKKTKAPSEANGTDMKKKPVDTKGKSTEMKKAKPKGEVKSKGKKPENHKEHEKEEKSGSNN